MRDTEKLLGNDEPIMSFDDCGIQKTAAEGNGQ